MAEPFQVFVTRWCLSQGIEEATAWEFPGNETWCVVASGRMKGSIMQAGQWHRTKKEAVSASRKLLKSVTQQTRDRLEELESIVFSDGGELEGTSDGFGEGSGGDEAGAEGQH